MQDPLVYLNDISLKPDPYSNKQWNQPSHHAYSKQHLYGPLKHVYNRKAYYGKQSLTLCIINYCFDTIDSHSYDNPQVFTYCYWEHLILFDTDHLKEDLESNRCDPWEKEHYYCFNSINRINYDNIRVCTYCYGEKHLMIDTIISNKQNPDPLKRAHSPQGMISLIDPTECCGIKRKAEKCYIQTIIRDPDSEVKLYHWAYLWCLGKSSECLKHKLQQSKCRDLLCSKQEPLKCVHPTECCIMKRKDGECHNMNMYLNTPLTTIRISIYVIQLQHDPPGSNWPLRTLK